MMKKNGFTLAEVLITLAIIGVVATLTLPSLMTNTAEQQAITAFRKSMNTLNEAGQMNAALEGFDYSQLNVGDTPAANNIYDADTGNVTQSLWGLLASRAQVDVNASVSASAGNSAIQGECAGLSQVLFRDGTALCYSPDETVDDNANAYVNVIIDTNGTKAPNRLSECDDQGCTKAGRHIYDQFHAYLRGSIAAPGWISEISDAGVITEGAENADYAAAWAMRK